MWRGGVAGGAAGEVAERWQERRRGGGGEVAERWRGGGGEVAERRREGGGGGVRVVAERWREGGGRGEVAGGAAGGWRRGGGEVAGRYGKVAEMSHELPPRWFCFKGPGGNRARGNRARGNRTLPSRNCPVAHDPLEKNTLITSLRWIFGPPRQAPPHTLYTHFVREKQLCLACRLAFVIYTQYVFVQRQRSTEPQQTKPTWHERKPLLEAWCSTILLKPMHLFNFNPHYPASIQYCTKPATCDPATVATPEACCPTCPETANVWGPHYKNINCKIKLKRCLSGSLTVRRHFSNWDTWFRHAVDYSCNVL